MKKEYDFSKLKELKNPYPGKKKAVGINLSPEVVDYFKGLAEETGLPYQKLIDLYLLDCAKKRKKLSMKWVAWRKAPPGRPGCIEFLEISTCKALTL
jgi:hypothetical protein